MVKLNITLILLAGKLADVVAGAGLGAYKKGKSRVQNCLWLAFELLIGKWTFP